MRENGSNEGKFDWPEGFVPEPVRLDERFSALDELVSLWEASVRSTHVFLTADDIDGLKPVVRMALESIPHLWGMADRSGRWVACMGVDGEKLEMLFVHPAFFGLGLGRRLTGMAVRDPGVRFVDVNEQNPKAYGFYRRVGFSLIGRSEMDGQGNPFPILHLKWMGGDSFSG